MRTSRNLIRFALVMGILAAAVITKSYPPRAATDPEEKARSVFLEDLTWIEAEKALKDYEVVLIALGARTKEHGPHLPLKNDYLMAEYLKERVAAEVPVAVLPTLQYGYYPSFLEYPGSVSIGAETFKSVVTDICLSMNFTEINEKNKGNTREYQ